MADRPILLVGSIPLDDAGAVFSAISESIGARVHYVPDGETGERLGWIGWQYSQFAALDALEGTKTKERDYQRRPPLKLREGADLTEIEFGQLGYAKEAIASYRLFLERRDAGQFLPETRFQVCLPTPFAPVYNFVAYGSQAAIQSPYDRAMRGELNTICTAIPNEDLAIQWDVATEMSLFEDVYPSPSGLPWGWLPDRLAELGGWVPPDVVMGYHLCYGSAGNKHWKEPDDLRMCVRVANALVSRLERSIDWLHMPVPIERDDDAYFRPLNGARWSADTSLYLGLVHAGDGVEGTCKRIRVATQYHGEFGISTECGLGRLDAGDVAAILKLHMECR